jgi:alanine dehydrogenase
MSQPKRIISTGFSYETLEETLDIKPKGARVHIGIPREILFHENRIALIPDAVSVLVNNGHEITIEHNAGEAAHYSDRDYSEAGARIVYQREEVYKAPVLVKSAPVMDDEIPFLQHNQMIISPIQLSALKAELLQKMMEKKITAISFENLKDDSDSYPIVRSMSEIAGSAVMLIAAQYLSSANHGKGVLLGGISGIAPTKVIILGAGMVGEYAARACTGLGASVKVFDNSVYRLKRLQNNIGHRLWTSVMEPRMLAKQLKTCEVAVGALGSETGRTPIVVTEEMVSNMRTGSGNYRREH